jgi:hypothetical protein
MPVGYLFLRQTYGGVSGSGPEVFRVQEAKKRFSIASIRGACEG